MTTLYVGGDVSKGYCDFVVVDETGKVLEERRCDDTRAGHDALLEMIEKRTTRGAVTFIVGVESTGGLERNWIATLRHAPRAAQIVPLRLNPLAVRRFTESQLRRNKTDRTSALQIANYLRLTAQKNQPTEDPAVQGPLNLYRAIVAAVGRCSQVKNEFQSLLPRVQPELVRFCRASVPDWILTMLTHYPTAPRLAAASHTQLAAIRGITAERATELIKAASTSVAADRDAATGATVVFLAQQIEVLSTQIDTMKEALEKTMAADRVVEILATIPGIGTWTAICLRCEIADATRFYGPKALIAFAGLEPVVAQSGDQFINRGISRRGRPRIRQILYMPALVATRHNPPIRAFYERLVARGKVPQVAVVACMAKLLRMTYACWIKDQEFDPDFDRNAKPASSTVDRSSRPGDLQCVGAPVSRREARRRKAVALPQVPQSVQPKRGRATAPVTHTSCPPHSATRLVGQSASSHHNP